MRPFFSFNSTTLLDPLAHHRMPHWLRNTVLKHPPLLSMHGRRKGCREPWPHVFCNVISINVLVQKCFSLSFESIKRNFTTVGWSLPWKNSLLPQTPSKKTFRRHLCTVYGWSIYNDDCYIEQSFGCARLLKTSVHATVRHLSRYIALRSMVESNPIPISTTSDISGTVQEYSIFVKVDGENFKVLYIHVCKCSFSAAKYRCFSRKLEQL